MNGFGTGAAEALHERPGKSRFRTQGDQLPAVQMAFQGRHRRGQHLFSKGAACGGSNGAVAQRAGVTLQFSYGREIALIEKTVEDPEGSAHQAGMVGGQFGEELAHPVVHRHQVGLPVETFKDYPPGAGGQISGRGLRSGYAPPNDQVHIAAPLS